MSEEKTLDEQILEKIEEMEDPSYVFPKRFSRGDYIVVGISVVICIAALIAGSFI